MAENSSDGIVAPLFYLGLGGPVTGILYKAAYMPSAIRITLRVVDDQGMNPKTLQREIWLRRRSR